MKRRVNRWLILCIVFVSGFTHTALAEIRECSLEKPAYAVRIATFNTALSHKKASSFYAALKSGKDQRIRNVARILQIIRPDIIAINEFDYDEERQGARWFRERYLSQSQDGHQALDFPYQFSAPSNTGVDSGIDLNNNGQTGEPNDAYGYGQFEGQYGMLVLSGFPIDRNKARTFQHFLWKDMPQALLPKDWYSDDAVDKLRLSSKSHWDLPILIEDTAIHLLVSHPTPPVFDGPEDRNGKRNHDEIRFWADYINDSAGASYMVDDSGKLGGIGSTAPFVIAGDLNADPTDGDSHAGAAALLVEHPLVNNSIVPSSRGGVNANDAQGGANQSHKGSAQFDTGDFSDKKVGNLRVDYVLPSKAGLELLCASVFWPPGEKILSDHRPVFIDVRIK